jgi:hypothetical protein
MSEVWAVIFLFVAALTPAGARNTQIAGDYLEVRTADVYVGACFANAEVGLIGKEAVIAWHVTRGSWQGTPLQGLSVMAVVKAKATLGDPHANPFPVRAIVIVDEKADPAQQEALVGFAHSMAGDLLQDIVRVERTRIEMKIGKNHGYASLKAGEIAALETRAIHGADHLCGNEKIYYPPLTKVARAVPGFTVVHEFRGEGLDSTWSLPGKRSAFIGAFSR